MSNTKDTGMDSYSRDLIISRLLNSGRDTRFTLKAYEFIILVFNVFGKVEHNPSNFSAKEIVRTTIKIADVLYGPIAEFVLADMGIKTAGDIGGVIFNLIDLKILSKKEVGTCDEYSFLSRNSLFSKVTQKPLDIEKLKNYEDT